MMWVVTITSKKSIKIKSARNYDTIIKYINSYLNVRKKDDYNFYSDEYEFHIYMSEILERR